VEQDGEQMYGEMMSGDLMINTQAEKRRQCTVCEASPDGTRNCSCLVGGYTLYTDGTLVDMKTSRKPLMMTTNTFTTPIANKVRACIPLPCFLPLSNLHTLTLATPPYLPPSLYSLTDGLQKDSWARAKIAFHRCRGGRPCC
jgi:hypothetical protein